jgi:formate-dependent nitrite reductase membrane component NrfD
MFSDSIVWYLFFAGTGSGAAFAAFVLDSYVRRFKPRLFRQYLPLITWGLVAGIVLVALGAVFLVLDLGRLDRVADLFLHPTLSVVTAGAWGLTLFFLVNSLQVFLRLYCADLIPKALHIAVRWLGALCSLFVMGYTGILLESLHAVHFWATPLLPVLFVLSSLSAGIALLVVLGFFRRVDGVTLKTLIRLSRVHIPLVACELLVIAAYICLMIGRSPSAAESTTSLLQGSYSLLFWLGVIMGGLLLPIALDVFPRHKNGWNSLVVSGVLLLAGALALRFCILGVGELPDIQSGLVLAPQLLALLI